MRMSRVFLLAALVATGPSVAIAAEPDQAAVDFFEKKIRPVLVEQCYSCHSAEAMGKKKLKGDLQLDTKDSTLKGGETGPAIVSGKPAESLLIKALRGKDVSQMPPKGKLPEAVIADFEAWIKAGAADPRTTAKAETKTGIDIEKGKQFWAFQAPKKPTVPNTKFFPVTAIDAFILKKLEEKNLTPAKPAEKRTLIRRVYFDLIGLPPTPEEIDAFEKDKSPEAFAKVVDRLLASPAYGERWARHWLDVARYAEDQAHTFGVKPKSNAFQYRDWVIKALNADMPYDKFVKLQLAGDLMSETEGDVFTRLAGLGYLGLGAEHYKNTNAAQAIADELDDRVDTVTRGFLGVTVSCARCHDHKFDPIPTKDYYSIAGIFNGSNLSEAPLASPADVKKYNDGQAKVKEKDDAIKAWLSDKSGAAVEAEVSRVTRYMLVAATLNETKAAGGTPNFDALAKPEKLDIRFLKQWVTYLAPKNASKASPVLKPWFAAKGDDAAKAAEEFQTKLMEAITARKAKKTTKEQSELLKAVFTEPTAPFAVPPGEIEKMLKPEEVKELAGMRTELEAVKKSVPPAPPSAPSIKGGGNTMKIFIRGNPAKQGELAPKGFLQVISKSTDPAKEFTRLDLANAIASKDNPLTARVIVNRVWSQHFGRGLVGTPSNFGQLGDRPTHPELLDYLTVRFIENGWSLKQLHRDIVLSATYHRSNETNPTNAEADPENVYLWRATRRRLEVEPWRDAMLAVAGTLDKAAGGPTTNLKDAGNNRRTVYAKISRHELDGLLRLFDFPDANVTADKRTMTTVPQQQLFVMNSEFAIKQAKAFAARVQKLGTTDDERIRQAYLIAFGRKPTDDEVSIGREFLNVKPDVKDTLTKWEQYAQALLAANEFMYID